MIRSLQHCRGLRFPTTSSSGPHFVLQSQKCVLNKISYNCGSSGAGVSHTITVRHSTTFNSSKCREVVAATSTVGCNCSESKTGLFALKFERFSGNSHQKIFRRTFSSTDSGKSNTPEKKTAKKRMVSGSHLHRDV